MEELSAFWMGVARADAGAAVSAFASAGGDLTDPSVAELLSMPGVPLSPWQRQVIAQARPEVVSNVLVRGRPGYPVRLLGLHDAPPVLFVHGDASCLHAPVTVGVVGTRRCSHHGAAAARELAHGLARAGQVVVSGLARGIDAEAHLAALRVGRTVAVLGHGRGVTAPRSNTWLRKRIVESGGALVSGWPDEVEPTKWTFPRRNRWIAALSDQLVVVEAGEASGALITADEASSLGKLVHVVPGLPGPDNAGGHELVNRGAQLITDLRGWLAGASGGVAPPREAWMDRLMQGATLDEVARFRGVSIHEVVLEVGRAELDGRVVACAGGRYGPGPAAARGKS